MSEDSVGATLQIETGQAVGICPNCGVVNGLDVRFNFPAAAECNICDRELEEATIATETKEVPARP